MNSSDLLHSSMPSDASEDPAIAWRRLCQELGRIAQETLGISIMPSTLAGVMAVVHELKRRASLHTECIALLGDLGGVVRIQNGNRHADINLLLERTAHVLDSSPARLVSDRAAKPLIEEIQSSAAAWEMGIWKGVSEDQLYSACYRWLRSSKDGLTLSSADVRKPGRLLAALYEQLMKDAGDQSVMQLVGLPEGVALNARRMNWIINVRQGLPSRAACAKTPEAFDDSIDKAMQQGLNSDAAN